MNRRVDPACLGPAARRQVDAALFAHEEQRRQRKAKPAAAEDALQVGVVALLARHEAAGRLAYAHVPNGGKRAMSTARRMKALGQRAGVPDLLVWLPGGRSVGIELKAPDGGRVSQAQSAWAERMADLGHVVYVCRSLEAVAAVLAAEGVA